MGCRQTQKVWVSNDRGERIYFEQLRWQRRQDGSWVDTSDSRMTDVRVEID